MKQKFSNRAGADVPADSSTRVFVIPESAIGSTPVSFVKLSLQDAAGHTISSNFYWLSAQASSFDWDKTTFFYTPSPVYEDFTALNRLAPVKLETAADLSSAHNDDTVTVRLKNPSKHLAFQVCLQVSRKSDGAEILPVLWDDNYLTLMPGESRTVTATFDHEQLQHVQPEVKVSGWNIVAQTAAIAAPAPSPEQKK